MRDHLRIGIGYDVHAFGEKRPLRLGGVELEHEEGLRGHSDADVLLHAIIDALLGAANLGDIGQHFPPDDPSFRDADSLALLRQVVGLLRTVGYSIVNVDATVIAERPRLQPHIPRMQQRIAIALGIPETSVSVKATTSEGLGALGRGEGIAALATALIQ
jgi:2-C-methyl-D-erythritol 2,4-cyclodiphosphate synthase